MSDTPHTNPAQMITDIREFIARCEAALDSQVMPDMTGLDEQVKALTDSVQQIKLEDMRAIMEELEQLMLQLNSLQSRLEQERDSVQDALRATSTQKQAHSAYAKTQGGVLPSAAMPSPANSNGDDDA